MTVEEVNQKLEEIHQHLYEKKPLISTCAIPSLQPVQLQHSANYSSPSKSTANSSKSVKSPANSNPDHDDFSDNKLLDFDNISVFSGKSFISNNSSVSQNSNYNDYLHSQKLLTFRDPIPPIPSPAKYTKSSIPFGNPFKITIRPSNNLEFNESDLVSEDDAFNTKVLEKKKASRLASFAAVYKSKVKRQISAYVQYYKDSKADQMRKIDAYLANLVSKHNEELQRKLRREKESMNLKTDIKMDEDVGQKRTRPENSAFELSDFGIGLEELEEYRDTFEEEFSEKETAKKDYSSPSQTNSLLKTVPFETDPEEQGFDAAESLFEDMFNLKEYFSRKIEATFDSDWQAELNQSMRMLRSKYREIYDPDHINKLIEKFVRDHFEIRF